jgi:aryl-alcohol dehydrogenase-like predicted oxidoreductase
MTTHQESLTERTGLRRVLGRSGIEVSGLGFGCWAIGGEWTFNGGPGGWGAVDDDESIRALRRGLELGVTFYDTAANYGAGHSEVVLGRAFAGRRDEVVLATKFGYAVDEASRSVTTYPGGADADVAGPLRADLQASLRRLGTDYIDVFQLHVGDLSVERALAAREVLDELVDEGLIRTYGWSTDEVEAARAFAAGAPKCGVIQNGLSILGYEDPAMIKLCEAENLGSINRGPLGMGLLTGKFDAGTRFGSTDHRSHSSWHPGFADGRPTKEWLDKIAAVREVLTGGGRTLAQGALAWIWARSPQTVPIPGVRTVAQVEENAGALHHGPLAQTEMTEIERILADR